ncbi:hypothetical protein WJ0W_006530 [Paenibacillus melissococcoides]|uniref:Phage neck terminator protein gp12-like domain-containing protein n=2 Tax=Paenibacillus melissococcoides TaxID=2912268 RepID=A0ABM9GCC6_9BACL|nr:hypothetical protein [Paenibacillus melissococcoides]CAH8249344.1 hypothetical protein WJ0W_006530 [Paenibacillus melissococcoides]
MRHTLISRHMVFIQSARIGTGSKKLARVTISITCYAKSSQDGYRISGQARDWFQGIGRNLLKDAGIVVVKLEATTARDTLLTYDYERRIGFDVHLRMVV